ncbi:MAG: DegT/DnrJ/EryC1/StrS family aminotransferase [Bacteroidales bacterium]|nr:DegT/DnrJ/EryC1/StrS family aminotransferase [Bacteroidales bacterium]
MILVTRPFLPPMEEYNRYLERIWKSSQLTNMGPLSRELEERIKEYLKVDYLLFVTNGTIALQMAIKALELRGEIITTPFSFVATSSTIVWEGCRPVFVDIDPRTLNIDPTKIEAAITSKVSAIMATHVYGNPCNVAKIDAIAKKYNLKVIYDAAHAFGVEVAGTSVLNFGDISTLSLHATKLFHTGEGGLMLTRDPRLFERLQYIRNFGFRGEDSFAYLGINGKNSELHAAMGLANLKYIDQIIHKRQALSFQYDQNLKQKNLGRPLWHKNSINNGAYYPVFFESEEKLLHCRKKLLDNGVSTRRYFYPSLATALPYIELKALPVTDDIAKRVLCLPLYYDLKVEEVDWICNLIM